MQRMKRSVLCCLVSFVSLNLLSQNCVSGTGVCADCGLNCTVSMVGCCLVYVWSNLEPAIPGNTIDTMRSLEMILDGTKVEGTIMMHSYNLVVLLFKPNDTAESLEIFASDNKAGLTDVLNRRVYIRLPREVIAGGRNAIVFSLFKLPEKNIFGSSYEVYDQRLVGLSVQGKNISGLQQRVNITVEITRKINETQKPSCQFFDFSTNSFSQDGCITLSTPSNVTCSCDHFTYFAVLMVPVSISLEDQEILTYLTLIGCCFSLLALAIAVLLFITNGTLREDASMKIHINLVTALILLNLHFLPSQTVAAGSPTRLCFYMALLLHYSLLATFSWMALEGFNLYLLVVKVFDIYVSRYLLKLCVVGWGVPAVIVSVLVIIDRAFYGHVSNSDGTAICYITNETVKVVTTAGLFSMVFFFNMIMFGVTVRRVFSVGHRKKFGHIDRKRVGQHICRLLGVSALLGITWGLVFFSFGSLTTPGVYLFCILNSLQGFFIFLWFVMSLRKAKNSVPPTSSDTRSTVNQLKDY